MSVRSVLFPGTRVIELAQEAASQNLQPHHSKVKAALSAAPVLPAEQAERPPPLRDPADDQERGAKHQDRPESELPEGPVGSEDLERLAAATAKAEAMLYELELAALVREPGQSLPGDQLALVARGSKRYASTGPPPPNATASDDKIKT